MTLANGTKLGDYQILAPLGSGGMGEVYRARDTKLGREVAIKVLPEAFASSNERLTRFEREARLLASLNHPHVATLHGFEESGGVYYLVMELISGETLAERIRRRPLAIEEAIRIFIQVADALHAAHEKSIVHRDVKPANIKMTAEGDVKGSRSAERRSSFSRAFARRRPMASHRLPYPITALSHTSLAVKPSLSEKS